MEYLAFVNEKSIQSIQRFYILIFFAVLANLGVSLYVGGLYWAVSIPGGLLLLEIFGSYASKLYSLYECYSDSEAYVIMRMSKRLVYYAIVYKLIAISILAINLLLLGTHYCKITNISQIGILWQQYPIIVFGIIGITVLVLFVGILRYHSVCKECRKLQNL